MAGATERPSAQYEFPEAKQINIEGVRHKCFEMDGEEWKTIGHIIVDYRLFFVWADFAEAQLDERSLIEEENFQLMSELAEANETKEILAREYDLENKLRLKTERDKRTQSRVFIITVAVETLMVVGLSLVAGFK